MTKIALDSEEIRALLPHRYPFLLVDRVLEISPTAIVAEKFVSANEPFFQGHFPQKGIMPGVLILEAMAQAAGIIVKKYVEGAEAKALVLAGVKRARFRKPVYPGSVLTLQVKENRRRSNLLVVDGVALVDGEVVADAELLASYVDWDQI